MSRLRGRSRFGEAKARASTFFVPRGQPWMAGTKASGSDAVLRTAMPGHDAVEVLAPDLSAQMRWLRPQTAPPIRDRGARTPGDYRAAWLTFH
ncbi:hypothetical protein MA20_18755 [Bradyrhizobium japonicum]|uniref:Uncharacterized protein n=1 Tax=Bradyrhizobium japonicum TaxID=375 RepID=A0A0A3XXY0_BRAJP|nr:hypothetical protein MA20_18755 [Bradyrhizobium japonicum]